MNNEISCQVERLVMQILDKHIRKADFYHYVCGGGSPVKMVDAWTKEPEYTCKYQGDKNWMTPMCEKCTGLSQNSKMLNDTDCSINQALKSFAEELICKLF